MPIPEMTPLQKYEQFCKTHPKYKKMSRVQICSIMVKEKLLTKDEMQELTKPITFEFGKDNTDDSTEMGFQNWGLQLNNGTQNKSTNYIEKTKNYHPLVKSLVIDKSGKVDLNQYTLQSLNNTYRKPKYIIKKYMDKNNNTHIEVSTKSGQSVMLVVNGSFGSLITFYSNPSESQYVNVGKNGEIECITLQGTKNGIHYNKHYDPNSKYPYMLFERYPNGDYSRTNYDDKTGKIKFKDYWKKGANTPEWSIEYTNGKPWKKTSNGVTEYPIVTDLEKDITAKNKLGLPTTRPSLQDNVMKRITSDNVVEILEEYEKKTGRSLIEDIDDEIGLSKSLRNKLIFHIENLYCKNANPKTSGDYLAQKLFDDIDGLGSGNLAEHVKMINSSNIRYVLTKYRELTLDKQNSVSEKYDWKIDDICSYLNDIPGIDISYNEEYIAKSLAPIEGLLTAISEESGLSQKTRNNLIKQIVDVALSNVNDVDKNRISKDIKSHKTNYHKVEVDLYRAQNTIDGDLRNPQLQSGRKVNVSNNPTFKGNVKQQGIGDCWLLAALNSLIAKPEMLKELEKCVKIDTKTGDYIVTFKGPNKKYRITESDFNSYTELSKGSKKVNAIEIAMDKYLRNSSYNDNSENIYTVDDKFNHVSDVDINGDSPNLLWNTLLGYNYKLEDVDLLTEDFSNPKRAYVFVLSSDSDETYQVNSKNETYSLITRHAYSIIGSDKENVYVVNPWDSSKKITISRTRLKEIGVNIQSYEIPA